MKRIYNAEVLRGEEKDVILYPKRKYRIVTSTGVEIDNCEFVDYDSRSEELFFRIDPIRMYVTAGQIANIEEV